MKKTIINISETANRGKSIMISSLGRRLVQLGATTNDEVDKKDYRATFIYKGIKIGIQSNGDIESIVQKALEYFLSQQCQIIVIPTKRHGATVNVVSTFAQINSFRIITGSPYQMSGSEREIVRIKEYAAEHCELMVSDIISERI